MTSHWLGRPLASIRSRRKIAPPRGQLRWIWSGKSRLVIPRSSDGLTATPPPPPPVPLPEPPAARPGADAAGAGPWPAHRRRALSRVAALARGLGHRHRRRHRQLDLWLGRSHWRRLALDILGRSGSFLFLGLFFLQRHLDDRRRRRLEIDVDQLRNDLPLNDPHRPRNVEEGVSQSGMDQHHQDDGAGAVAWIEVIAIHDGTETPG